MLLLFFAFSTYLKNSKFTSSVKYTFGKTSARNQIAHGIFDVNYNFVISCNVDAGEYLCGENICYSRHLLTL